MIDLVADAKRIADEDGETFVAHLLSMAILEMQTIRDLQMPTGAATPRLRPGRPSRPD